MMLRVLPTLIEPAQWTIAFHRTSKYWFVRLLAFGVYKHVSAFAYVRDLDLWLYFDVTLGGTKLLLLPDSVAATAWIADRTADADLLTIDRQASGPPLLPFYCVSAVKSLVGLRSSALRCDRLYADCLRAGAERIDGTAGNQARPDDCCAAAASGSGG